MGWLSLTNQNFHGETDDRIYPLQNTALNCDVPAMLKQHFGMERPAECPEFVKAFIEADRQGSESLKQELTTSKLS